MERVEMPNFYDSDPLLELEVPDAVPEAKEAVELIRAWVADGSLAVALNGEAFGPQMEEWGRVLAQIGRHIARAAALCGEAGEEKSIEALRRGFDTAFPRSELVTSGALRRRVTH